MTIENPTATDWAAGRGEKWSAHLYEMEAMLSPVDAPLISALQLTRPCRIADIGCGGGGTTLELFRRAPAGSVVHGYDISAAQIEAARRRIPHGESGVAFDVADAAGWEPERPYDRLASRFGTMFFADPQSAFANLYRWVAPDGRLAFAVWADTADNPWIAIVRESVAQVVELPASDPEGPGPFRYGQAGKLTDLLAAAGFDDLEVRGWHGSLAVGGGLPAPQAAQFALTAFSSFGDLLSRAGSEAFEAARQSLTARFARYLQDGVVRLNASAHLVTGCRTA